ncbi:cytidylate kinase [Boudabousia tangfeifanii]|uniref:Cytidylate kinase n=1 Tax=Boudabousia tangfeifanii TaxID=1912795 RepID=A0A1D9MK16_9ACTO|nr:(d)CMP kinase [Boudabousia tangfeifanii]AOZ72645.1 cytidylate kinase [Boudabousia tangfeifanii]
MEFSPEFQDLPKQLESQPLAIVLDGPAGSGKSTVAKEVADFLGAQYLDTGAMYRAATVRLLELGVELSDQPLVAQQVAEMVFSPSTNPLSEQILVDGTDVSGQIRLPEISEVVSKVATNLSVRATLVEKQRAIIDQAVASGFPVVAEGRDLTTVVAPHAQVRAIITASEEVRLARRGKQIPGQDAAKLADQVLRRDRDDATVSNFTSPADGVVVVDTTDLTLEESVESVLALVANWVNTPK